jgi:4-amino-4-deoxy-L-arabinose transferase-like glycosyltransferase
VTAGPPPTHSSSVPGSPSSGDWRRIAAGIRRHGALGLILLLALSLRLLYITAPLLDAHRWRQVDTAYVTQALYEGPFNPFEPEVNWGGAHGRAESEFPLLPAVVALIYKVAGPDVTWGRLTVVLFSVGVVLLTYLLVRQLEGHAAGLAAATLVAASPGAVFYGRAFMPDSVMIFFSLGALIGFMRYFAHTSRRALVLGSLCLGLTVLVKLPGVIVIAPMLAAAWSARRWGALRDRRFLLALVLPGLVSLAWYAHAYRIYLDTGLTFGVFGTTKTYPLTVAPDHWPTAFSKWSSWDLLTSGDFYETILTRLYYLHLTPAGFALSAVGLVSCVVGRDGASLPMHGSLPCSSSSWLPARATWATTTTSCPWCRSPQFISDPSRGRHSMPTSFAGVWAPDSFRGRPWPSSSAPSVCSRSSTAGYWSGTSDRRRPTYASCAQDRRSIAARKTAS